MRFTLKQYEEAALTLENDSSFYRRYAFKSASPASFPNRNETFGQRRKLISEMLWQLATQPGYGWMNKNDIEDRDQLRRYLDERWNLPRDEDNVYGHIPSVWGPPDPTSSPVPTPAPEENTMSQIIEVTVQTLVNGKNVKDLSDSQLYELIREQEDAIRGLEQIENKPRKLTAEIAKRKAGIVALVAHLDSSTPA